MSTFDKRNLIFRPWIVTMSHVPVPIPLTSLFLILLPTNINIVSDSAPVHRQHPALRISGWYWSHSGSGPGARAMAQWPGRERDENWQQLPAHSLFPSNFLLVQDTQQGLSENSNNIDWCFLNLMWVASFCLQSPANKHRLHWQSCNYVSWVFALTTQGWYESWAKGRSCTGH